MIKEFYTRLVSWIYVTINREVLSPDKFIALRLRQKVQVNKTNFLFTFDLPKPTDQIGLLAGQYIAVKYYIFCIFLIQRAFLDGEDVVRYYSPVSRNSEYGKIDLLIKIEPEKVLTWNTMGSNFTKGNFKKSMCNYLSNLLPGNTLDFKGPLGGFEYHRCVHLRPNFKTLFNNSFPLHSNIFRKSLQGAFQRVLRVL